MMSVALEIFNIVFPVFLLIGIGYFFNQTGFITAEFNEIANKLVFNFTLPILLVYKIGQADFTASFNYHLVLGGILSVFLGFLISIRFATLYRFPPDQLGVFTQGAFRGNFAIVGLAVVMNAYGSDGVAKAGILLGFLVPELNLLSVLALLIPHHQTNKSYGLLVKSIVYNPLIIGSLLGIGWSLLQIPFPTVVDRSFDIISNMTLPLALIAIGGGFTFTKLKGDLLSAFIAVFIKNLFIPTMTLVILLLLGIQGDELAIGILLIASPTAAGSYVMASQMKGDTELAGSIVVLSTLFSIMSYPLTLWVLKSYFL